jgi:predicted metal-dependent hydrolase
MQTGAPSPGAPFFHFRTAANRGLMAGAMNLLFKRAIPAETALTIGGETVPITVRVNARARSYRLSLPNGSNPVLTLPPNGRWREAEAFLIKHRAWLAERLAHHTAVVIGDGALVPLRGISHRIVATGRARGRVEPGRDSDGPTLLVPGEPQHLPRRLIDWMRSEALCDLTRQTTHHAGRLGVSVRSVKLRSQSTRWGSCSSSGNLNYNWRLVAAPPFVLDYVAAHEVAHLVEMNHSPAFWATVKRTLPDMERGRAWLKANGRELMRLGV